MGYTTSDFDFELPAELIAQHPTRERSASRLLDATDETPVDRVFSELPRRLDAGDLIVYNDTKVIKARLYGVKESGGKIEALVERVLAGCEVLAHLRASKAPKAGSNLRFADAFDARVQGREGAARSLYRLRLPSDPFALLARHGHVPLPPYITHADTAEDELRYQTVFAARPGAVAAPTAALHFDAGVLDALRERGVNMAALTLHVGAGTFQPVRVEDLAQHRMHSEWFELPPRTVNAIEAARAAGKRIVAAGTTSLRALESAAQKGRLEAGEGETTLFVTPGYRFRVVDTLITNLHLPRSSLLMLVAAFSGLDRIRALYAHAIEQRYRFYSYGDAMLLPRNDAQGSSRG